MAIDIANELRLKRFRERFEQVEAETGITFIAVLDTGPFGIVPKIMPVEKKALREPEAKEPDTTNGETQENRPTS
jgi:hypothetical protein